MEKKLQGLKVAILVTDGFEQSEMVEPRKALQEAGAQVDIISPKSLLFDAQPRTVRSWKDKNWGTDFPVDVHLEKAHPDDYDALLLPGGVINPDILRMIPQAIEFITAFVVASKPIGAICHGPWTLINAGGVNGKTVTSWTSVKIDLINAGAHWVDKEVVRYGNLVTSRKPQDIPAFNKAVIELFSEALKK